MFTNGVYYSEEEGLFESYKKNKSYVFVCDLGEDVNDMFFYDACSLFNSKYLENPSNDRIFQKLSHFIQSNFELV